MKPSLKTNFTWVMLLAAAFTAGCAHVGKISGPVSRGVMPRRCVQQVGDNESVALGQYAVAVAGNGGKAKTHEWGAAVTGDGGGALVSKGGVVLAGDTGCASVGDSGMAMTGYRGHADGYWRSAAMVHAAGHAVVDHQSVAMATGGVAEVRQHGVAIAGSFPDDPITYRGIAVAGPCGIALAWESGVFVRAGAGGAVGGYWAAKDGLRLALCMVGGPIQPDTFYRFTNGEFVKPTDAERLQADRDFAEWGSKAAGNCVIRGKKARR